MTPRSQERHDPRWLGSLAALVAALAAILLGTMSSASAAPTAGTGVGPHCSVVEVPVEPPQHVSAGQHQGRAEDSAETVVATAVAAETVPSGLPRDALGRFTSGAGGESGAAAVGRTAHANYANTLGGGDYVFDRALPDSLLRPDAVSYSQNIVRELKPATPSAIARGWRQVNQYKAYLEELTGQPWTAYVDTYTP